MSAVYGLNPANRSWRTTDPRPIMAAHLGLGESLPDELCHLVDGAFFENYQNHRGHHGVLILFHMRGSTVVFHGDVLEGDDAVVIVTASAEGRSVRETLPLADVWRLAAAGLEIEEITPAISATAVFGLAESVDRQGRPWATALWDQRGAAVALLDPETFNELMTSGNDRRRVEQVEKRIGEKRGFGGVLETSGKRDVRVIAAGAAQDYLAVEHGNPTDGGPRPVWWQILRFETLSVAASNGPFMGEGPSRAYRLRSKVASEVSRDAAGRTKLWAKGSTWKAKPLVDNDERADDPEIEEFGVDASMEADGDFSPGSPGDVGIAKNSRRRRDALSWVDPTGAKAAALTDGDITMRELMGGEVVTPDRPDARTAVGTVIDRLLEAGLTKRQAWFYANDQAGFSQAEIAKAFGCTVSTVKNTVAAARRKLGRQ